LHVTMVIATVFATTTRLHHPCLLVRTVCSRAFDAYAHVTPTAAQYMFALRIKYSITFELCTLHSSVHCPRDCCVLTRSVSIVCLLHVCSGHRLRCCAQHRQ
jgi:hypothetical protein